MKLKIDAPKWRGSGNRVGQVFQTRKRHYWGYAWTTGDEEVQDEAAGSRAIADSPSSAIAESE